MSDIKITPSPYGTWEYVPAGGMALTAEQVENVRAAREELRGYRNFTGYGRSHVNQLIAAVDALFPATEPAEEETKAEGPCEVRSPQGDACSFPKPGHAGVHTWAWPDKKPAGEETRAECVGDDYYCAQRDSAGNIRLNCGRGLLVAEAACTVYDVKEWWARADRGSKWERQYQAALDLFDREASSSPVVPAPTETGPWQDISEAPKHLTLIDRVGDKWTYDGDNWITPETAILPVLYINRKYAPFVAAEEG